MLDELHKLIDDPVKELGVFINCTSNNDPQPPIYTQTMADNGELPSAGMECMYKERGGINWCRCKVIAIHCEKIWILNLDKNSAPLNNISSLEFKPLTPPKTDKENAIEKFMSGVYVHRDNHIINAIVSSAYDEFSPQPLTVASSFIQTLAQAYEFCGGKVPHRHKDVLIGSNIIVFVTPCIKNLFYLTFPKDRVIPDGFKYFCTVQEFVDFVPTVKLINGKAYQFEFEGQVWQGIFSSAYSMRLFNNGYNNWREDWVTNIQPLTVVNQ